MNNDNKKLTKIEIKNTLEFFKINVMNMDEDSVWVILNNGKGLFLPLKKINTINKIKKKLCSV